MEKRLSPDMLAGVFLIGVGLFSGIVATDYTFGSSRDMGPGYR